MPETRTAPPDLFTGCNHPADPRNLTDLEKKHLPVISAPDTVAPGQCFEVTVEVGKLLAHPNERGHYISFIELYAGDLFLARLDLTPLSSCPRVTCSVALEKNVGPLRAFQFCNLHGTWEGTRPITVR